MRQLWGMLAICASVVLFINEGNAQTGMSATGAMPKFATGFTPAVRNIQPINPSNALTQAGGFKTANQTPYGVGKIFPKISLGKWPPTRPTGSFLSSSPYQPKSMGPNLFGTQPK